MDNTDHKREKTKKLTKFEKLRKLMELFSLWAVLSPRPTLFFNSINSLFLTGELIENWLKREGMGPRSNEWVNEVSGFICWGSETNQFNNQQRKIKFNFYFYLIDLVEFGWVKLKTKGESWVGFVCCSRCGLWAQQRQWLRPREANQTRQLNSSFILFLFQWSKWNLFDLVNWRKEMKRWDWRQFIMSEGMQWNGERQFIQSLIEWIKRQWNGIHERGPKLANPAR